MSHTEPKHHKLTLEPVLANSAFCTMSQNDSPEESIESRLTRLFCQMAIWRAAESTVLCEVTSCKC